MENINVCEPILQKKLDGYIYGSGNDDNFAAEGELMVTITLNEYRTLVANDANKKYRIDEAEKNKYERDAENRRLKEENEKLRNEIYRLREQLNDKDENKEENENE